MKNKCLCIQVLMLAAALLVLVPVDAATSDNDVLQDYIQQAAIDLLTSQFHLDQAAHELTVESIEVASTEARVDVELVMHNDELGDVVDLIHIFAIHDGNTVTHIFREPSPDFYLYADKVSPTLLPPERFEFWAALKAEEDTTTRAFPSASAYKLPWTGGEQYHVEQDNNSHYDFGLSYKLVRAARGGLVYVKTAAQDGGCCDYSCNYLNNYVRITHSDGTYGWYLHLKFGSIQVTTGDQVSQGACLGTSGATGYACGAHLHFNTSSDGSNTSYLVTTFSEGSVSDGTTSPPSQNSTASCTASSTQVIVEEPVLTPAYGAICSTGWHAFTNNRNHQAYLTLNTNDPGQSTNSGRWTPNLPQSGRWRVEAFVANHGPMTWPCTGQYISWDTSDARYAIHFSGGVQNVSANQGPLFDGWLDLGVFDFAAGSSGYVELKDLNGEVNLSHFVSFSAMRFTWEGACSGAGAATVEEPALTPAYGAICSTGWYLFTNDRGHSAYLTLNTNDPAQSTNSGRWAPNLAQAGNYRVEAYVPNHGPMTWPCIGQYISWDTTDARYKIRHNSGTTTVSGNQSPLFNQWLDLGVFSFNAGTEGYVELADLNGEANLSHFVSFSAMRFTPQLSSSVVETLILTNRQRLESLYGSSEATRIVNKLNQLAVHPSVQGKVIQVESDASVVSAYSSWLADLANQSKANAVAASIRDLIDAEADAHSELKYIVLVGDDRVVPFHREVNRAYSQENGRWVGREQDYQLESCSTTVGAALCSEMNLTDNYYGDKRIEAWHGLQPHLPDLAVGRLIENSDEIVSQIDAFLASDGRAPTSAAVVAYDPGLDTAAKVKDTWQRVGLSVNDILVGNNWGRNHFIEEILTYRHDLVSLIHHSNHYTIFTPTDGYVNSHDISASSGNHLQTLFFSLGCHSGLNVSPQNPVDSFDLPQVFVRKGAIYVGNTGYGWNGTQGVGLSDSLLALYAGKVSGPSVSVGQALVEAKRFYALSEKQPDFYDEKILLEATLYGLPHYEFRTASRTSLPEPGTTQPYTTTSQSIFVPDTGLTRSTTNYSFPEFESVIHDNGAFYTLAGQSQFDDGAPLQPRVALDVSLVKTMAHGAVLRSASYLDMPEFNPVVGQAVTDDSVVSEPDFEAPGWYPSVPFTINRFDSQATLALVLGQYNSILGTERIYSQVGFDVYYHDSSTDWTPPTLTDVFSAFQEGQASVSVQATDETGIHAIVVAYTDGTGAWKSVDLSASGAAWTATFPANVATRFLVQVVDGAGNVAVGDNSGRYFVPGQGEHHIYLPLVVNRSH